MLPAPPFDRKDFDIRYVKAGTDLEAARTLIERTIEHVLDQLADRALVRTHLVEARLKDAASLAAKAVRNGWSAEEAFYMASDVIGARVVCENIEDVPRVTELLREAFAVAARNVEVQIHAGKAGSGYRATHINGIVDVPRGLLSSVAVPFEVQIRTLLEDAWGKLTHRDIYKGKATASPHLHTLAELLARHLRVADELAQEIRNELSRQHPAPSSRPDLDQVTADGIAFLFRTTFGRNPAAWVVSAFSSACEAVAITSLSSVEAVLADSAFRERLRTAYYEIMNVPLDAERLFLQAPSAAVHGKGRAVAAVRRIAKRERKENETRWRDDVLSSIPASVDDLLSEIEFAERDGGADRWIIQIAGALGASHECGMCEATIVDPEMFEKALYERLKIEELDGRVVGAIHNSGVEVGDVNQSSLCNHCAYLMDRDD